MKMSLIVGQGKLQGKEIPITLSPFLIGRDPQCHLRPASPLVSKRHCALVLREGKAYLRDFDSTNGTHVNNKPVKGEVELHDGDELKVGPVEFAVKLDAAQTVEAKPEAAPKLAAVGAGEKSKVVAGSSNSGRRIDEDAVADMLLSFGGEELPKSSGDSAVSIPAGSTVMDVVPMSSDSGEEKPEEGTEKKKGSKKQKIDNAATSDAAKAILEKYMRRPRT